MLFTRKRRHSSRHHKKQSKIVLLQDGYCREGSWLDMNWWKTGAFGCLWWYKNCHPCFVFIYQHSESPKKICSKNHNRDLFSTHWFEKIPVSPTSNIQSVVQQTIFENHGKVFTIHLKSPMFLLEADKMGYLNPSRVNFDCDFFSEFEYIKYDYFLILKRTKYVVPL